MRFLAKIDRERALEWLEKARWEAPQRSEARAMHVALVHAEGGERADFEERRAGIDERRDALSRQQLAARHMALARPLRAALAGRSAPIREALSARSATPRRSRRRRRRRARPVALIIVMFSAGLPYEDCATMSGN